ncbi:MAG: hypothetical protein R3C99_15545 [Pirellulaceae bacterium]|nr:hypothetical protein [Planctomycetales bacterium]MCA9203070.1 hypothetical protein [Planctomycetales bacterium]MCA9221690.1 hypothetical protein [Planctomycetales bacterium]MCA9224334.1 hypothetical protein [Planctomycetales bacterium]
MPASYLGPRDVATASTHASVVGSVPPSDSRYTLPHLLAIVERTMVRVVELRGFRYANLQTLATQFVELRSLLGEKASAPQPAGSPGLTVDTSRCLAKLREIRHTTRNYMAPVGACGVYEVLLRRLSELDEMLTAAYSR